MGLKRLFRYFVNGDGFTKSTSMTKPIVLFFLCLLLSGVVFAQPYTPLKTNWQDAGYKGTKPTFSTKLSILNYGADNTGSASCNFALKQAIAALNSQPGVIYFPAGTYFFDSSIVINRDSIVIQGAGYDSTTLRFNLAGKVQDLITTSGTKTNDTSLLTASGIRGSNTITVASGSLFQVNDWIVLNMNDQAFMTSSWAFGYLSQMARIQSISGNNITLNSPLRANFSISNSPKIRRVIPRNNIGFECLKIQRMDATAGQSSNINFSTAANCWVNGIESDSANFAHVDIVSSSNIEVTNNYFHHAFAYGGGGQGYGILLEFGSNECKIESNYFYRLRHSMMLQIGANGNVLAYNYSQKPFWTEPSLPDSSAGEIVLHGDYPFMNLAEGNFINNIVIDDSHGKNGPWNTIFRNRAAGYGIFMNFSPATDSVQFIGNEITNPGIGLYFIQGKGHFQYGNNQTGTILNGTSNIPDTSLYLQAGQKPLCMNEYKLWPVVGRPGGYNTGSIYAKDRVAVGKPAGCSCVSITPNSVKTNSFTKIVSIFPNPVTESFSLSGTNQTIERLDVTNSSGMLVKSFVSPKGNNFDIRELAPGFYIVRVISGSQIFVKTVVKE